MRCCFCCRPQPSGLLRAETIFEIYLAGADRASFFFDGDNSCASKLANFLQTARSAAQDPEDIKMLAKVVVEFLKKVVNSQVSTSGAPGPPWGG